ncbi:hypothetical protein BBO99_00003358 [Phytophthora kernoviae]|uniref:Uncharacterized protein n=2 Tax=Phytophthora kernoviae TaxID=325452 RepID=A0A421GUE5_9STRA|nr:hypothetical protein G195_004072 [Phytophthora kernoviae 00238/432]KAG2528110.1 hypothetical protein JM16_003075 [Phytophthora kernoviae]KAG2529779.1 hypothetical protein JM18_002692 [Phytophthora kernoviae]RLN32695.1 hypothetical protein BBI17_002112 [Phytophthora kernoviae]RLN81850.1 hypothetical protein BBO99_00003358 [Phytophthora kernoviae]
MAASKSRCVTEDAEKDNIFVPPVHDFESTEIPVQLGTIPPEVLQRERSKARTEYLELRLRVVAQSELEVQEEEEKAGPCEEEYEPPQRVFIFEHFVKRLLTDKDSPTSWENTNMETRQKEVMLALMDPAVQIAAMRNNIELPDVSWFVERVAAEEEESVELSEVVEKEEVPEEPVEVAAEEPEVDFFDNQRDQEEEELRRLEEENATIALELIYMAQEDTLSREYNNTFVESDDEGEEHLLGLSKRTDFSQSYFFGNLPGHYRKMVTCGWRTGSGINNGDEEFDEEEQLAREHERQRLLDEQEAERLLELERQAERARIEKEREEGAFQSRRVRQAELKK